MSELQPEAQDISIEFDGPDEVAENNTEIETPEGQPEAEAEGAELATAGPEEAEKTTDDGNHEDGDSVQRAINKQHRKFREEERKRLALEKELAELKAAASKANSNTVDDVDIPPLPDAWDDDYDSKMKERDDAIMRKAQAEYLRQQAEDKAFLAQQEMELRQQQERSKKIESYAERAKSQGIKEADLIVAANRVADSGVSPDIAEFLLTDKDGPAITAYLADDRNVMELYELASMNPVSAGIKLNEIRAKASVMKQKASSAPTPPEMVGGRGGLPDSVSPLIKDASFE